MHSFMKYLVIDVSRRKGGHTVSEHETEVAANIAAAKHLAAYPGHNVYVSHKRVQES